MKVGLIDVDGHNYPNLALMKLSAHYKALDYEVELADPENIEDYDIGFASKVFSYSPMPNLPDWVTVGGSGIDLKAELPEKIEHTCPDYSLYGVEYSLGFLTRGCIRKCEWCIVPEKEGRIKPHADITEFAQHRDVVLMDNNVLACEHGLRQLEKIAVMNLRVDFNQVNNLLLYSFRAIYVTTKKKGR